MSGEASTQDHLPIAGIQDGAVIMNDGTLRCVLKIEPTNFELKSETEQDAIIYSYQAFLNSLSFPIQIIIQSKKLDLEQYLVRLQDSGKNITSELLRLQLRDYISYLRTLITRANIMSKHFYVVISFSAVTANASKNQLLSSMRNSHHPTGPIMDQREFERLRTELHNRADIIGSGLSRIGSKSELLDTQRLIELFYTIYNPEVAAEQRLSNVSNLSGAVVSSEDAQRIMVTQGAEQMLSQMQASAALATPAANLPPGSTPGATPGEIVPADPVPVATQDAVAAAAMQTITTDQPPQ